ncbi:hypothetical protein RUND412_009500 [Rhizina undulata]
MPDTPNMPNFTKVQISILICLTILHLCTIVLSVADHFNLPAQISLAIRLIPGEVIPVILVTLAIMTWYLVSLCSSWLRRRDQQLSPQAVNNVLAVDREAGMIDTYLTSAGKMEEVGMASGQTGVLKLRIHESIMAEAEKQFKQEQLNQRYRRRYN